MKNSKRNVAVLAPERRRRRREGGMNSKTKNACSNEELRGLTLRHFPEADDARFIELSGGMFNAVYLIESRHLPQGGAVLKIGPDPETEILTYEKEIMHAEIQAYQLLSSRPIPTPKVLAYDLSRQKAPFDYFFMEKVQGRAWNDAAKGLPGAAKRELMKQLGRCNAAVHGVCGEWFGYVKADERFHFDSWGGAFCAMMGDVLDDARARGFRLPFAEIERTLTRRLSCLNEITRPKLVDFDMWAGNVFIDRGEEGYRISGVIDFERCFYGDPFADFTSAAFLFKDVEREPEFCGGYASVSGKPLAVSEGDRIRMDLYRLYMAVILVAESYRYNDAYAWGMQRFCAIQVRRLLKKLNA